MFFAYRLMLLYIWAKFCESISKGLGVKDLNSWVDARVVANIDAGRTDRRTHSRSDEQTENRIPITHHARSRRDKYGLSAPYFLQRW